MAHRALPGPRAPAAPQATGLPWPQQLAALGAVLCLYRTEHGGELVGWAQAVRAEVCAGLDSDGLREALRFYDVAGRCCWRLYLLPDSDFLAWDRLLARLPREDEAEPRGGVGERLWRRLAGRLRGEQWRACALRLHALPGDGGHVLAASLAQLSPLGSATARGIARAEGADAEPLPDECCCAASASVAAQARNIHGAREGAVIPWLKTDEREHV